jgi:glycosyltransferase involved in cell wall biosynthesis
MEGFGWYTFEICKRLVENHPEHEFFFFFDRKFDQQFIFAKNVKGIVLNPPARHPFLFYLWYNFSVSRALKKNKIDVFFSPDGYLSLWTKIPQIITIHDINFEHRPEDIPFLLRKYLCYFFPKFARKATKILTVSAFSKNDIAENYSIDPSKIRCIWNGASDLYRVLSKEEIKETRLKYSKAKNYFLFVGSIHPRKNLERLILAFEQYRLTFPTGFDLVIVGEKLFTGNDNLQNLCEKPALKNSIHFTGHLPIEELIFVTGAAGALTFIPLFEGFGIPLVEGMKAGIPIITGNLSSLPEVVGKAALLVNPYDVNAIANTMKRLASDEDLQRELAHKSLERGKLFSWDGAAKLTWEEIIKL